MHTCPHCHMPHNPHVHFSLLRGALRALLRDCTGGLAVRWQRDSVCEFPSICFLTSALQVRTVMLTPSTSCDRGSRNAMQRPQLCRHSCKRHSRDGRGEHDCSDASDRHPTTWMEGLGLCLPQLRICVLPQTRRLDVHIRSVHIHRS